MNVKELIEKLNGVDPLSEVIAVIYTDESYESGYVDRVDTNMRYNSVTKTKLKEDESVVELTTSTRVK